MSKRYLAVMISVLTALVTSAADRLLSGSNDFDTPSLWGSRVVSGSDNKGGTTGKSYWYTDIAGAEGGWIYQHAGTGTGYFSAGKNGIHRTISLATATGPAAGEAITERAVYTDMELKLTAVDEAEGLVPSAQDRMLIWVYNNELRITAATLDGNNYQTVKRVYTTGITVDMNVTHRIVTKAYVKRWSVDSDDYAVPGYEITFDGVTVRSTEGVEFFPSMVDDELVHSAGFIGGTQVEYLNFTRTDPAENPTYYQADVSMLRQAAELTVSGYEAGRQTLYDFPLLVRISPSKIYGFNYDYAKADGSDVRFTDESGKLLSSEIDVWDVNGESLIWVKVPFFYSGVKIVMHWDLMPGGVAPINHASDVWSDYLAVWHFKGNGSYRDATGNGYTATMGDVEGIPSSAEGGAVPFGYAAMSTNAAIVCANIEKNYALSNGFTFTGFYIGQQTDISGNNAPALFGKRTNFVSPNVQAALGWAGSASGKDKFAGFMDGQSYFSTDVAGASDIHKEWFYASFSYDGSTARVSANDGSKSESKTGTITAADTNLIIAAAGAWVDEARITKKVRSEDWLYAEYSQWNHKGFVSNGGSIAKVPYNYWVKEPSITPSSWTKEDAAAMDFSTVFSEGVARYGVVIRHIYNEEGAELSYYPTNEVGVYRVVYTAEDGELHSKIEQELTYMIFDQQGYSYLPGQERTMLFNSDVTPGSEVGLQSYYDVDSEDHPLWWHSKEQFGGAGDFVARGSYHFYCKTNTYDSVKGYGEVLWTLRHCYIGNLFQDRKATTGETINHLPWTEYARRYDNSMKPANNQSYVGNAILQNLSLNSVDCVDGDAAAIYTPYYTDGVGSIYFDAVNSHCGFVNVLKVQVCREPAADENSPHLGNWEDVPVDVYTIEDGKNVSSTSGVYEVTLTMENHGGSTNSFYRIRANVNSSAKLRLRIVRADTPDKGWSGGLDGLGLVSIDNIVVSPLAMGVELENYGAPDNPADTILRGWRAPFSVAFPTTNDIGKLHGAVRAKYMVAGTNRADASWIGAMTMKYRWRYLNQYINDWKTVRMIPKGDDAETFVTESPLDAVGVGDIEYSVKAVVNAPFYIYHDYAGLNLALGSGFSERRSDVVLSAANEGLFVNELSPARGRDYFVRIREGVSDYEGVRVYVRKVGSKEYPGSVLPLDLCGNHTWRGFWQTLKAMPEGLEYRVEFINYQDPNKVPTAYNWSTNYFCGVHTNSVPVNGTLVEGAADKWQKVDCDALTGYLMFQVEDQSRSVTIIHADYQNFNRWSDAWSPVDDPYFTGSSQLQPTSGVSQLTCNIVEDFSWLTPCTPSNGVWWIEHFNEKVTEDPLSKWCINKKFIGQRATPNGWAANNGMWVSQRYSQTGIDSMSFQMMAGGFGSVGPSGLSARGIEKLDFTARLAQSYQINSFDPYVGGSDDVYNFADYAFGVACAMRTKTDTDFNGAGAISLLAYYRETKGAYELRVERIADNQVRMSLYKWTCKQNISGTAQLIGKFDDSALKYNELGFGGYSDSSASYFARCYISCYNTPTSTWITAGIAKERCSVATDPILSGANYYRVRYEDTADDRLTCGTVAIGSKDCPARFGRPQFFEEPVANDLGESWKSSDGVIQGTISGKSVVLGTPIQLLGSSAEYDKWNIHIGRLEAKDYEHDIPYNTLGFKAAITPQKLLVNVASRGSADYSVYTNVEVSSFGLMPHHVGLYSAEDIDVKLATSTEGDTTDIVVDDLELTQWRGINIFPYGNNNKDDNPDRTKFPQTGYGSPSNIVYTTAWVCDDRALEISPMRTTVDLPSGVRGPLFDGESGRGSGLGQISFTYRNADPRARLLVQIATNDVAAGNLADLTVSVSDAAWITVGEPILFDSMSGDDLASGTISRHIGLHGVKGVMRIIVDTNLVNEAHSGCNIEHDPEYGRIFITQVACKDNPDLGDGCWWGWNLRTTDDETKWLLKDGNVDQNAYGKSFGLNNSVVEDVRDDQVYDVHMPFLQTPIFMDQGIGEVSFKARRYELGGPAPTVTIYGLVEGNSDAKDDKFERLGEVLVTSDRFENYSFQANLSKRYHAFRFAVTGVDGVTGDGSGTQPATSRGPVPKSGNVERVLIDEVAVFEAIKARLGFSNTGCFRTGLPETTVKDPFPIKSEQPLCGEAWGFQTELYAAQLSEKLILNDPAKAPRVFVHWYQGKIPWGYDNWRDQAKAVTRELERATDTERMVFRSSYESAFGNVVDPIDAEETRVFQYSMDVVYYMQDQESPLTNTLSSTDWVKPLWYEPIDYNAQYGNGVFSAYNLLDTVAPGWAWVNEVNIFGGRDSDKVNQDLNCQYVEIAAPQDADLTGWKVRFVKYSSSDNSVYTNTLATLDGYKRKDAATGQYMNSASGMVFRVLASPNTAKEHSDWYKKGWLDGTWNFDDPDGNVFDAVDFHVGDTSAFGIQLVRPTGIVEHEVVTIGTNKWASATAYQDIYSPTCEVSNLNRTMPGAHFFYIGDDDEASTEMSLSVTKGQGEISNYWDKAWAHTPGCINVDMAGNPQELNEDAIPVPLGSSIYVTAQVVGDHILQTCGGAIETNSEIRIAIQRGGKGTNVVYTLSSEWYVLGSVTTNNIAVPTTSWRHIDNRRVEVKVGEGCSNNVTLVASARPNEEVLSGYGVEPGDPYVPAIISWLEHGTDLYGYKWPTNDIKLASFWPYSSWRQGSDHNIDQLTLKDMYWLDMCPRLTNDQYFIAGFCGKCNPIAPATTNGYDSAHTNVLLSMFMAITNGLEHGGATCYAPYVLRGLDYNYDSQAYCNTNATAAWTSVTFKVTGILRNGKTKIDNRDHWVPQRWFVFSKNSFTDEFTTEIEIRDPFGTDSPGYVLGWTQWANEHGRPDVWWSWAIDDRMMLWSAEEMKTNNYYRVK